MGNTVYIINKGINKPIEFKGLKAQYIWLLGGGLLMLLVLFAILYLSRVDSFICVNVTILLGIFLFTGVYRLSNKYGQYGAMKKVAKRGVPTIIKSYSRTIFLKRHRNGNSS